jgi:hypothetical protein
MVRFAGAGAADLASKAWLPGTDFWDPETGRRKSALKYLSARRDQSPASEWPEIPAETPYSESYRKRAVCEDWMVEVVGHKLATHHPVIEPVSAPSRERKFTMQRRARKGRLIAWQRPIQRRAGSAKSPHSGATNARMCITSWCLTHPRKTTFFAVCGVIQCGVGS